MKNKYVFVAVMLSCILLLSMGFTYFYAGGELEGTEDTGKNQDEEFVVVTSFYPMYIAAMNVIGETEGVTLKNLSEPQTGCLHDFQLTPADMKLLSTADVFVINGGGIESFIEDIAESYPNLAIVEASEGIDFLCEEEAHGHSHDGDDSGHQEVSGNIQGTEHVHDVNAHVWMSVADYRVQVSNIARELAALDEKHGADYKANAVVYDAKLVELEAEQEALYALTEGQESIMFHCAFDYVARDFGLEVAYCMDLDEERQVSAGEVAEVLEIIKEHGVKYIFAEELYGAAMCETIQKEADVSVIYLDPLNRGEYDADSYIEGMTVNIQRIKSALQ